jgi:hypothetical protein
LALGSVVLVATPVLIGLLLATILGIPLGLLVLAAYAVVFGPGLLAAAYRLGSVLLRWLGKASDDVATHSGGRTGPIDPGNRPFGAVRRLFRSACRRRPGPWRIKCSALEPLPSERS